LMGPTVGGTSVTISGTSFTGATVVDFGTTAASSFTVVNDTTIMATSPAGTGTVDVTVTTPSGTSATSPADQFTFTAVAAPAVTGLSPNSGPPAGGTTVTITGTGFAGATVVDFGTTAAAAFTVVNDDTITATSPAGNTAVNVTVTTPGGTSPVSAASQFTFVAVAPTVVSLMRFGFHMQQTTLVLTFSTTLAAGPAENVSNYDIMTTSGVDIPITSAVYDPSSLTVTLTPSQLLNIHTVYQLTVTGTTPNGLTSATGVPLAGNGTPGTDFVQMFSGEVLAGASPALKTTQPKRFAAEERILAAQAKAVAAKANHVAMAKKKLAAAEKRLVAVEARAAIAKTATANRRLSKAVSASGVDALSASGELTAKPKAVRIHLR
jgi:hypothetical protein